VADKPELTLDPQPTGNGDEVRADRDFVLEPAGDAAERSSTRQPS